MLPLSSTCLWLIECQCGLFVVGVVAGSMGLSLILCHCGLFVVGAVSKLDMSVANTVPLWSACRV